MNRFDIINRIGDKYRIGNTETGEFSYAQALKTVGKDIKDYQKATTGAQHKFLDIRFENDRLAVLVECKNKFSRWDKDKIQGQLQDYVRFEKAYSDKKIVLLPMQAAIGNSEDIKAFKKKMMDVGHAKDFIYDYTEAPKGTVAIWPVTNKGEQCVWRLIPERLMSDWKKGYIKVVPTTSPNTKNKLFLLDSFQLNQLVREMLHRICRFLSHNFPNVCKQQCKRICRFLRANWDLFQCNTTSFRIQEFPLCGELQKSLQKNLLPESIAYHCIEQGHSALNNSYSCPIGKSRSWKHINPNSFKILLLCTQSYEYYVLCDRKNVCR